ncbi:AAA-like domain-containing protein [Lusitaniella coriacea]|uniref:WD40 domain-containing protein n=1 Tax=Lusitaniella coriacea TaxID=1983105 RepID=UPI003CF91109
MNDSHYQVGGSLSNESLSYVERDADSHLYSALKRGEFCYVLNSRQMGKSSLLVRVKHRLEAEGFLCLGLDMTSIGSDNITPEQWYKSIASGLWLEADLLGQVNLKAWWRDGEGFSLAQRLNRFIREVLLEEFPQQKIVIFIDEIDSILSLNFSIDDFFALIRYCYNQRAIDPTYQRVTFAIFGVATPSDLIADKKRTPFNIGEAIELRGFTLEEAHLLAKGLTVKEGNPDIILREILAWTQGQPFLTQKLCQLVIRSHQDITGGALAIPPGTEAFWVESLVRTKILYQWESKDEPEHLRTIRDRVNRNVQRAGRLLGLYQQILQGEALKADDSRDCIELILSGLVAKQNGVLAVKNRIYQEVFNLDWVENQLRSLRPYSEAFNAWIASQKKDESRLLLGQALREAELWSQGKSLSDGDYQFLAASESRDRANVQMALEAERTQAIQAQLEEERKRRLQEQTTLKLQRLLLGVATLALALTSGLSAVAYWQFRKASINERAARISEIKALASSAEGSLDSNRQLEALVQAIKANTKLRGVWQVEPELKQRVQSNLRQVLYSLEQVNSLSGNRGIVDIAIASNRGLIAAATRANTIDLWRKNGEFVRSIDAHNAEVRGVAFSPNGKLIASASADGTAKLWQTNGTFVKTLEAGNKELWDVKFSPDGKLIATASADKTVKLWRRDGSLQHTFYDIKSSVRGIAFSPDGKYIVSASVNTIQLWRIDGTLLKTLAVQSALRKVAFSPDGQFIAASAVDNTIQLWKIDGTRSVSLRGHKAAVRDVAFSPNGEQIASASADNTIKIWKPDGTLIKTIEGHQAVIRGVTFCSDGNHLISASEDGTIRLWQRQNPFQQNLMGHNRLVRKVAFSPNGKRIASASGDKTLKLWRRDGTLLKTLTDHRSIVFDVDFDPQGQKMASVSRDGTLKLRQSDGTVLKTLIDKKIPIWGVKFSPNGKLLAAALNNGTIEIWRSNGTLLKAFNAHAAAVRSVDFSPDGTLLVSGGLDDKVKIWRSDGTLLKTLTDHRASVREVAFSPDGRAIASASADTTVKLWRTDGTLLRTLKGHKAAIWGVAFSPDGKFIASASMDNTIILWQQNGRLVRRLRGHNTVVRGVAFSPDGKTLASASDDRSIVLWDLQKILNLDELEFACDWVRDYLKTNPDVDEEDRNLCDTLRFHSHNSALN